MQQSQTRGVWRPRREIRSADADSGSWQARGGALSGGAPGCATERTTQGSRCRDFGGTACATPDRVELPDCAHAVSRHLRDAATEGRPVAVRGAAHSQAGHTMVEDGIVIDTARLDAMAWRGADTLEVGAGVRWGAVLDAAGTRRRIPPVFTDSALTTVGGTLSAGGFGATSHRYGAQTTHVERLEVVTPAGDIVLCSREVEPQLFDAVRAGHGQFGIITRAWLRLRRCGSRVRHYALHYDDAARLARDLERLFDDERLGHVRVQLWPDRGEAVVRAGTEYEPPAQRAEALLEGLGHVSASVFRDSGDIGRAGLVPDTLLPAHRHHPWRDWLMPWSALRVLCAAPPIALDWLAPPPLSWVGMYLVRPDAVDAPQLAMPEGERCFSYSILPVCESREEALRAERRLKVADRVLVGMGGRAYISGRTGYGRTEWRRHFGRERYRAMVKLQHALDPLGLLRRRGLPVRC